jgi:DNA-binding Lrp family transcriptional regulator
MRRINHKVILRNVVQSLSQLTESQVVNESRNHEKMAEMVKLIAQRGPRIDEIAREIGVYKETARYWYRSLLKNGFTIQASCNYEKLGMKRVVVIAELTDTFREYADAIFYAMGELAYVVSFAKSLPEGYYVLNASIPVETLDSWSSFMVQLKLMGIFESIESVTMDWVRNVPMWADYFNFQTGSWEFDWNNMKVNPMALDVNPTERQRFDNDDLRIIEQLQLDANMPLTEMCGRAGAKNYKTFAWHYRTHVFKRGLIKGYQVNWTGTKYDPISEKPVHKKHRHMWVDLIVDGVSDDVKFKLMGKLNQTPFVWLEAGGPKSYFARMAFPTEAMPEALELLEDAMSLARDKIRWLHMDQAHALWFTLPDQYYDEKRLKWNFNKDELLTRFDALVQKIKAGIS